MVAVKQARLSKERLVGFLRQMMLIRRFEERCAEMYARGKIGGFLHLYIGEEAVAVGAINALGPKDTIVGHYRDHGHALVRGIPAKAAMAELFGKETGCSKGRGGSMHLYDASLGFLGGHAIVGGQLPMAVGLALASQYRGEDSLSMAIFGDGAVNQGEFHESLNLASLWKLPVLFLLENNGFGMGTRVERACAQPEIYKLAERHNIPARQVDGMDVLTVHQAALEAVAHVRSGQGPFFLEVLTYRFRGHSMADPIEYRRKQEEETWRSRDPIALFRERLQQEKLVSAEEVEVVGASVETEVEEAVRFAEESPFPKPETLYDYIYA